MSKTPKLIPITDPTIAFGSDMDAGIFSIPGGTSHLVVNGMDVTELKQRVEELEKNVENLLGIVEKILDKDYDT